MPDSPPEKEHWPEVVVQRFERDDPIRPHCYVVLDGTQSSDFTDCETYVPLSSIREQLKQAWLHGHGQGVDHHRYYGRNREAVYVDRAAEVYLDSVLPEGSDG